MQWVDVDVVSMCQTHFFNGPWVQECALYDKLFVSKSEESKEIIQKLSDCVARFRKFEEILRNLKELEPGAHKFYKLHRNIWNMRNFEDFQRFCEISGIRIFLMNASQTHFTGTYSRATHWGSSPSVSNYWISTTVNLYIGRDHNSGRFTVICWQLVVNF